MQLDTYIQDVIKKGDEGSALLAALCAPTLKNSPYVQVLEEGMNGLAVLRLPQEYTVVVHSAGGDPKEMDLEKYGRSAVERLVQQARAIGATPVGMANVVDSKTGDKAVLQALAAGLVQGANHYEVSILNGENAILGSRVNCDANLSVTMISIVPDMPVSFGSQWIENNVAYAAFHHKGKAVLINSDGIGTKTEFYERLANASIMDNKFNLDLFSPAVEDFMAMNEDDLSKRGGRGKVISGVVETRGVIPVKRIQKHLSTSSQRMRIMGILQHENVGERILGYHPSKPSFNISGSAVSLIDEERLKNPLKPSAGEYLIAIHKRKSNPRSNGITDKRKAMVQLFGNEYEQTDIGKLFLEYLAEPSAVLYPVFAELIDKKLATSVYHMSGGAFNGKLAKPLAKHGLFAEISNLFPPDWRELTLGGANFTPVEIAYSKWPLGNDGFITTTDPLNAIALIEQHGYDARNVSKLKSAVDGKTGVELIAYNNTKVYFSGK